jgi:hypothetical protein
MPATWKGATMPDIINLKSVKDRRFAKACADLERWENISDEIITQASEVGHPAMVWCVLRAMLDVLTNDMSLDDAKAMIAQSLNGFRE